MELHEGDIWCDVHCDVHAQTNDPYGYGYDLTDEEPECNWRDWRKIWIGAFFTQDPDPPADTVLMTNTKHGSAKAGSKEWGSKGRKEDGKRLRAGQKAKVRQLNKQHGGKS